ncbi:50S ribosomal protein L18 [Rubrobacter taiwanensis]|jgi:large subunit ribosomal protein L18|uniref:Large ribosomal subunit protein uL18 n=1 Tax=Rubrobacter taiwanensis TaxID=185139 RepID=A0A4R1BLF3_9ACTN|nr:50S ribosomal protein L18 [Rubrobacter taiwanensis]TCJ18255.1 50S ribosomal protein L18 [Rubrobacter taiwanensis]
MPTAVEKKRAHRARRRARVRRRIFGTPERPRISVFRSNRYTYAQLIDDIAGHTLAAVDTRRVAGAESPTDAAYKAGELLAKKAAEVGIERAVFDRGGYKYHGRVRALAEGARSGGLKF